MAKLHTGESLVGAAYEGSLGREPNLSVLTLERLEFA